MNRPTQSKQPSQPLQYSQNLHNISSDFDYLVKVLIIGDSGVGKSSMMLRYADDTFTEQSIPTIGVDFKIRTIDFNGKIYKMQIWDTAGQERFRTITSSYYRGAQGIVIVYDISNRQSFDDVKAWLVECQTNNNKAQIILVGNKCDLPNSQRQVSTKEGKEFADALGYKFIETSAKSNVEIDNAFILIVLEIGKHNMLTSLKSQHVNLGTSTPVKPKKCCNV